jgi:hypothetical protein
MASPCWNGKNLVAGMEKNAAAGVVGGAVDTAGAIATAPFRAMEGGSYAVMQGDASYCAQRYRSYDPRSGTFMGYDGRRHPCQ